MSRLSDYAAFPIAEETLRLSDIEGEEVTILDARVSSGEYGDFVVLSIQRANAQPAVVVTGATNVVDAIRRCINEEGFPVVTTFRKVKRMWLFD